MSELSHVYAVILAGGGGTRLWPKSRQATPKQFLKLVGDKTMIEHTAERITRLLPWDRIIVVTNHKYQDRVAELLPKVPRDQIIAEPEKKDTALAMLVGSLYAHNLDPEAIVVNLASDHTLSDEDEFDRVVTAATHAANSDKLVTVGISPSYPATGFGYIKIGADIGKTPGGLSVFSVESFTEKPNEATARAFISTGKYFWNANMYVWKTDTIIEAFRTHLPTMLEKTSDLQRAAGKEFHKKLPQVYKDAQSISIDYAISEKTSNLILIPGDFGWDDIGEWRVVYEHGVKDLLENVVMGNEDSSSQEVLAVESRGNIIHLNGRLVALIGVNDFMIIDTGEILMIAPKDRSQDVKKLVTRLKEEEQTKYL